MRKRYAPTVLTFRITYIHGNFFPRHFTVTPLHFKTKLRQVWSVFCEVDTGLLNTSIITDLKTLSRLGHADRARTSLYYKFRQRSGRPAAIILNIAMCSVKLTHMPRLWLITKAHKTWSRCKRDQTRSSKHWNTYSCYSGQQRHKWHNYSLSCLQFIWVRYKIIHLWDPFPD